MTNAIKQQNRVFDPEKRDNALRAFLAILHRDRDTLNHPTSSLHRAGDSTMPAQTFQARK
jgi:hypothetical protein